MTEPVRLGGCDVTTGPVVVLMRHWSVDGHGVPDCVAWLVRQEHDAPRNDWVWRGDTNTMHWRDIEEWLSTQGTPETIVIPTMNRAMVDRLPIESAADVRRRILWWESGRLRNMSEAEAVSVWTAYSVGVEHLSGVLVSKGMW